MNKRILSMGYECTRNEFATLNTSRSGFPSGFCSHLVIDLRDLFLNT